MHTQKIWEFSFYVCQHTAQLYIVIKINIMHIFDIFFVFILLPIMFLFLPLLLIPCTLKYPHWKTPEGLPLREYPWRNTLEGIPLKEYPSLGPFSPENMEEWLVPYNLAIMDILNIPNNVSRYVHGLSGYLQPLKGEAWIH